MSAEDRERGLYPKYFVERLNDSEGKHDECVLFVLDIRHDPLARTALRAYAEAAHDHGYLKLSNDLTAMLAENAQRLAKGESENV